MRYTVTIGKPPVNAVSLWYYSAYYAYGYSALGAFGFRPMGCASAGDMQSGYTEVRLWGRDILSDVLRLTEATVALHAIQPLRRKC